ncbi:MAG TPA: hypothetical protein VF281_01480 [Candidatus Saccharimonadales bacterium]
MKFVPNLCVAAALLLLTACSMPAPETPRVVDAKIVVGEGSMPKPTQTTWVTLEPEPTESTKSNVGPSDSMLDECEKLDKAIAYRFQKSGVKCAQVLELRVQFVQDLGEQMADWALLAYHSEFCTEKGGKQEGEQLPYDPSKKSHGEELLYKVKPGQGKATEGETLEYDLGKFVPCRQPMQPAK